VFFLSANAQTLTENFYKLHLKYSDFDRHMTVQSTFPHPWDLEIQEFDAYDLIIDSRSPREFSHDHLPGAVNFPVVDDTQYAEVGTLHRENTHLAYVVGVTHSLRNMANWIESIADGLSPKSRVLVYCFRGGKRSKLWSDTLRTIGYRVDVVPGGWRAYRNWVIASLEVVPRIYAFKVLTGSTGTGKTRLLAALKQEGAQVLDLEGLAMHRGSLIGAIPGVDQPTQKSFDSALLEQLRRFDPALPVWVEGESRKIGNIQLPLSLLTVMWSGDVVRVSAPMSERVRLWREDFGHFETDPMSLIEKLKHLRPLHGAKTFEHWETLANEGKAVELFEHLMRDHYDPAYARSTPKNYSSWQGASELNLESLRPDSLCAVAKGLIEEMDR